MTKHHTPRDRRTGETAEEAQLREAEMFGDGETDEVPGRRPGRFQNPFRCQCGHRPSDHVSEGRRLTSCRLCDCTRYRSRS